MSRQETRTEREQSGVGSNDQTGDSDRIPPEKTDSASKTPSENLTGQEHLSPGTQALHERAIQALGGLKGVITAVYPLGSPDVVKIGEPSTSKENKDIPAGDTEARDREREKMILLISV